MTRNKTLSFLTAAAQLTASGALLTACAVGPSVAQALRTSAARSTRSAGRRRSSCCAPPTSPG